MGIRVRFVECGTTSCGRKGSFLRWMVTQGSVPFSFLMANLFKLARFHVLERTLHQAIHLACIRLCSVDRNKSEHISSKYTEPRQNGRFGIPPVKLTRPSQEEICGMKKVYYFPRHASNHEREMGMNDACRPSHGSFAGEALMFCPCTLNSVLEDGDVYRHSRMRT